MICTDQFEGEKVRLSDAVFIFLYTADVINNRRIECQFQ